MRPASLRVGDRVRLTGRDWADWGIRDEEGTISAIGDFPEVTLGGDGTYLVYQEGEEDYSVTLIQPAEGGYAAVREASERVAEAVLSTQYGAQGGWGAAVIEDTDPAYYRFPGGVEVRQISAHLTSFGGQAVQYVSRSTRLDGQNKGDVVKDLEKAIDFIRWEIERVQGD